MHVLAVTPHWLEPGTQFPRLQPETIRALFTQTFAGSLSHVFMRDNPEPVPGQNIVRAYRRLREIFLAGPYDWLWVVENDILPLPAALEQLLAAGADIAYGVYCFRRGTPTVNVMQPASRNPATELPGEWARAFRAGRVVDCGGLGLGCTLIRRAVLERLEFRSEGGGGDADSCLAVDAPRAGFTQKANLGVVCGHKRPDGVVIWPAAAPPFYVGVGTPAPRRVRVRALRSFAYFGEHRQLVVGPGQTAEIDADELTGLVASGYAEYVA